MKTNWNDTQTAYNLWARLVDRPAEWWFRGSLTMYIEVIPGFLSRPKIMTPDRACRAGYAHKVLEQVRYNAEIMGLVL